MGTTPNPRARAATPTTKAGAASADRAAARAEKASARSLRRWGFILVGAAVVAGVLLLGVLLGWFGRG